MRMVGEGEEEEKAEGGESGGGACSLCVRVFVLLCFGEEGWLDA